MPLILGTNSIKDTAFDVANSLRFDKTSNDSLTRTPSSTTNTKTFTLSLWVKRSDLASNRIFSCYNDGNNWHDMYFSGGTNSKIEIVFYNSGYNVNLTTSTVLRDPSAWYHIVIAFDTTQSTASNRVKIYINGNQETSFDNSTYPSLNFDTYINNSSYTHYIGKNPNQGISAYMSEVVFIDGQQLDPTSFGEFDSDSNIWKPIDVSELTFGTNGFYLDFENASSLGADVSGQGNNFTVNNLTSVDQSTDTCTNNFATLNPLATNSNVTLSEGNLKASSSFTSDNIPSYGTIGVTTGKWYWEVKLSTATFNSGAGLAGVLGGTDINFSTGYRAGLAGIQIMTTTNGTIQNDNSNSFNYFSSSIDNGDILGVALDATNKQLKFNLNGGSFGSNLNFNSAYTLFIPATDVRASSGTPAVEFNFGSPSFAISSSNTDGNGYGNFEYAVPSGYFSLCTKNLAEFG